MSVELRWLKRKGQPDELQVRREVPVTDAVARYKWIMKADGERVRSRYVEWSDWSPVLVVEEDKGT